MVINRPLFCCGAMVKYELSLDFCTGSTAQSDGYFKETPTSELFSVLNEAGGGNCVPVVGDGTGVESGAGSTILLELGALLVGENRPLAYKIPSVAPPPIRILRKKSPSATGMLSVDFLDALLLLVTGMLDDCCAGLATWMVCVPIPVEEEKFCGTVDGQGGDPAGKYENETGRTW